MTRVEVVKADITRETSDAIVNAANPWLENGGGVAGAIHCAAGPALLSECMSLPVVSNGYRCPPGEARITGAGKLKCRYVIHTVGPNCQSGYRSDVHDALLAAAYHNSLELVAKHGLKSVSFPSISTGIYAFPKEQAAKIAATEIAAFLTAHQDVKVRICLLGHDVESTKRLYEEAFADSMPTSFPTISVSKRARFPDELSYDVIAGEFRQTANGATCPRHGYIDGVHYIAKCETFQQLVNRPKTTSEKHVHNEFVADGVIRGMGFNVPESREYRTRENRVLVRLAKFIAPTRPLCNAWDAADSEAKEAIRRQVVAAYPLQHLIAGFDTFHNDNVLVTEDGRLWFVDNGASFGWSAMGAYDKYYKYNRRTDPCNPQYGFLSLRDHPGQKLLHSVLSGVADAELWAEAAKLDVDRFVSLLPADEYDVSSIRTYAETLAREAKKHC